MAKQIIAIDIDDVLADSTDALRRVVNDRLGINLQPEDYRIKNENYWQYYEAVWKKNGLESQIRLNDIEPAMIVNQSHVLPHDGALSALNNLGKIYKLVIVTSRPRNWRLATEQWLEKHFPDIFSTILFTRESKNSEHISKGRICAKVGVSWLIDDNVQHAQSAIDEGVDVILFGDYGWHHKVPKNIRRCKNWYEVLEFFDAQG